MMKACLRVLTLLFMVLFCQPVLADKVATNELSPALQLQLFEAEKAVLTADKNVLLAQERLVDEKTRNQKAEHEIFLANEEKLVSYTAIAALIGLLFGVLSTVISVYWFVRKRVEAEIERNSKPLAIIAEAGRYENRLKLESKLLVLHGNIGSKGLAKILWQFGFKHVESERCPELPEDIDLTDYDQVIFDRLDEDHLMKFVGNGSTTWHLAYKEGPPYPNIRSPQYKVAFVNSEVTLYPRLMELLVWNKKQKDGT